MGRSLSFSCLKKKGLAYGDLEGRIRPEASCSSTQRFISTVSSRVNEYSLVERCPGSFLNSILISKSGRTGGSSSHLASLNTEGYRRDQSGVGPELEKRVSGILAEARVLVFRGAGVRWERGDEEQGLGQRVSFTSAFTQSISGLCCSSQSCPRITMWDWVFPSRKWIRSWWSPTITSKSIPYWILPFLFCVPSTLYIVIGVCRGDGSSPILFTHSKSMKQLVHPELTRAFVVAPLPVLRASKCTWMASSRGMCFRISTLSFSSAPVRVCLRCKIVYLGILAAGTGTERGWEYLFPRLQFGLTGPRLQNPAPQQEPSSLSRTTPSGLGATLSHSRSPRYLVPGFPRRGPVASGSAGACPGRGTLAPCGQLGHIGNKCARLRGHGRDPPPWHHQYWQDAAWWGRQGCGPVAGLG